MPATYESIASQTMTSSTTTVTFDNIPGTYTDLILVANILNTTSADQDCRIRINSDSSGNYSRTVLRTIVTTASSGRNTNATYAFGMISTVNNYTLNIVHFMNYSNTTTNKTILFRANDTSNQVALAVDLWRSTAAITRLDIDNSSGQFASGSTLTLYGIKAA